MSPDGATRAAIPVSFTLNGKPVTVTTDPVRRLTQVLRDDLGQTGTKVGCDAGDCGACTVLLDGAPVCACMVPVGRLEGHDLRTVEGLAAEGVLDRLQRAFLRFGAAQCGICTPGMLMAAGALLAETPRPTEAQVKDALGGVLCRCTGYRKIIQAVMAATDLDSHTPQAAVGAAVGSRIERLDGNPKVTGADRFGADTAPEGSLVVRVIRSPFHRAAFDLGDLTGFVAAHPGLVRVLTAADVPGRNLHGVIPDMADQPVFAVGETRYKGEAVAAVVGEAEAMEALDLADLPVTWTELPAVLTPAEALAEGAPRLHDRRPENTLMRGLVQRGELAEGFVAAAHVVEGEYSTGFIEHAYIEPEAGYARRVGDRIEVVACTQAPYMDRDDVAAILGLPKDAVRIIPTAVGGGFGSKLDLSLQPYVALAAWLLDRPARITYTRPESMASTTKRHPSHITARIGADADGRLTAMDFLGTFNTGAYASWGPTVGNRVPVHASGPYVYGAYRARSHAVHTNCAPSGAFRGFGVPQSAVAQETLFDELAERLGIDPLDFRLINALDNGSPTVTGQVFDTGVGFKDCLRALKPHWERARAEAAAANAAHPDGPRRGVGVAGMWYGCGNTSLPNPSTLKVGVKADGSLVLFQGAVDIGQGSNTVMTQICADALGLPVDRFQLIHGDTDLTPDAGKTSASRQTFVSGKASYLAGRDLRAQILRLTNASDGAAIDITAEAIRVSEGGTTSTIPLAGLKADAEGFVLMGQGTFDPPTSPLDANGQGEPYAVFGYGAHMVELAVDTRLGTIKLIKLTAAHDVGRAINPLLVEGQVEGGVAQGIGLALMEEFVPGRSENLHDYLIPTAGDVPEIETLLIEAADPLGPYGAKGIGEQALIPTAPAILNAIRHATGARVRHLPATPGTVLRALKDAGHAPVETPDHG
ncbi:MAG: molybdopterin-dependent oxidoreductase [Rhodobacterales bacterium]|nr:molybdopterin-dependent oxidoreductase [Rhodobacterales bacterium]